MAPREVSADDVPAGNFTKVKDVFQKVGDKWVALFEKAEPAVTSSFGGTDYTWQLRDGSTTVMTVNGQLEKMLEKCELKQGEKVTITLSELKQPTKEQLAKDPNWSAKRVFHTKVDDIPKGFKSALQDDAPADEPENTEDAPW